MLKQYLGSVKHEYDFILLGCMPSLGMLTMVDSRTNYAKGISALLRETAVEKVVRIPLSQWCTHTGSCAT